MKNWNAPENPIMRRILVIACGAALAAAALAVAFTVSLPQPAQADAITLPDMPDLLKVEAGNNVFFVGHARGTQNYVCLPSATAPTGFAFTLFTPQATLFGEDGGQVITHFFSPNPAENGTIRATWQHSRDTSTVWAKVATKNGVPTLSTDPKFVEEGAVAWVLLERAGVQDGPDGGDVLTKTTFVQRLNTHGGVAPPTDCATSQDVGRQEFVPYTADYFFYQKAD